MKKHIFHILRVYMAPALIAIFFLPVNLIGQDKIEWLTIQEAITRNSEQPKKIIIDVYTDWCGWCKRMDAGTFSDEDVARYMNENFYPVKLNGEHREDIVIGEQTYSYVPNGRRGYNELAALLLDGRLGYPSIVYLGEDLSRLTVSPGYKQPADLLTEMVFIAEEKYLETDFESFKNEQNSGS